VRLVGTEEAAIVGATRTLLHDEDAYRSMANAVNPYGDGRAAERTVAAMAHFFGLGERPEEFMPELLAQPSEVTEALELQVAEEQG
jgi:UDP-N-acetylglucosamine 2-epimerase (non-hydrolysing)